MPIIHNDPNHRRRYDAFRTLDELKVNPLAEAVATARAIEDASEATHAWLRIAEFVYAKPKHADLDELDAIKEQLQSVLNETQMLKLIQKLNYGPTPNPSPSNGH